MQKTVARQLKEKYISYLKSLGHVQIPSYPLVPENNPSLLFVNSGMFPLVPYLLGEPHPAGKRLCNIQKCVRTEDIDSVGNPFYHTFFEMLGHWSLGDYFKETAIEICYNFLTKEINLDPQKLAVTIFAGNKNAPFDEVSKQTWLKMGIAKKQIYDFDEAENWWLAGNSGPCGPDSEVFVDTGKPICSPNCSPSCKCGKYFEVWNNVFMEFNQTKEGKLIPLKQKNVDVGIGVDRTSTMLEGKDDNYLAEHWTPTRELLEKLTQKEYAQEKNLKPLRILLDHTRSIAFFLAEEIIPTNVAQGYIVRRVIRRAMRQEMLLGVEGKVINPLVNLWCHQYKAEYPQLENTALIQNLLEIEQKKFTVALKAGTKYFAKILPRVQKDQILSGRDIFDLYQSYGFPAELTQELAKENNLRADLNEYLKLYHAHKISSQTASQGMFEGGLAGDSQKETAYHTATHLLHGALRKVLGDTVGQKGSNITPERLRFDFSFTRKLTADEIAEVEKLVNQAIADELPVTVITKTLDEARQMGAVAFFAEKYGEQVKIYTIHGFSCEVCGGPHVKNTRELGKFEIIKEESAGSGVRRIKAVLS
ncbi:MAG: alanine--tRNA ligase [Patescibacteria group bacterium]